MNATRRLLRRLRPLALLLGLIWVSFAVDVALGGALSDAFGVVPRRLSGLDGVLAMPFLHADLDHLLGNTAPLAFLGALILVSAPTRFLGATLGAVILGGALLWLFGRDFNHIGASGLIFGWFGFLVVHGLLERSLRAILGALGAGAFYGVSIAVGLVSGIDENGLPVSWDGHLTGLIAGAVAGWVLSARAGGARPILRPR